MSSEPTNSSALPGRSRPALSELSRETTEEDLWNLGDELAERPATQAKYPPQPRKGLEPVPVDEPDEVAPPPEPQPAPPRTRGKTPAMTRVGDDGLPGRRHDRSGKPDEIGDLDEVEEPAGEFEEEDEREELSAAALRVMPETVAAPQEVAPEARPSEPEPEPTKESPPRQNQRRNSAGGTRIAPRFNRREILGLAAFAFTLLLAAIWVLTRFFSAFEFKSQFAEGPDFPVKGEHITLAASETYWREPVRIGEARDFARREVSLIPVLELTLDSGASSAGALLVIFRNSQGQPVGDSIRRSFSAGRFDASGNTSSTFPATDGFIAEGDFNAYRSGKGDSWTADVFEGPSVDAPADHFKPLATIPVVPTLR